MQKKVSSAITILFLTLLNSTLYAAYPNRHQTETPAACAAACGSFIFIILTVFILNIAMMIWIAKDAKNRGMDSAVGWVILAAITSLIGFVVYLFARPGGTLVTCRNCRNKKLQFLRVCPHCGETTNNNNHIKR